jgi:formylglycine-generating enzyme required for sulfatase activity
VTFLDRSMRRLPQAVLIAAFLAACSREPPTPAPIEEGPSAADSWATLTSLARWDTATPSARRVAAEEVARRMPDFTLLRMATFSCGGQTHEMAIFRHAPTEAEFALVPGGTFVMGEPSNAPQFQGDLAHQVTLTHPFLVARTETTQATWKRVMDADPSESKGDDLPVEHVSWTDAGEFCSKTGLSLPTDAQWEFACRAGTTSKYPSGDDAKTLVDFAWIGPDRSASPHPVGARKPNPFGLFDMAGNVNEWCADMMEPHVAASVVDPFTPADARHGAPVWRGGDWKGHPEFARSAARLCGYVDDRRSSIGFRAAKTVPDFR